MNPEDAQFQIDVGASDRYGGKLEITPVSELGQAQAYQEGVGAAIERQAAVQQSAMELPPLDPFDWGTMKEGQTPAQRRQEVVEIASRRRARKQAQKDEAALTSPEAAEARFKQAQQAATQRLQADMAQKATQPRQRIGEQQQRVERRGEAFQRQQRQDTRLEEAADDQGRFASLPDAQPPMPAKQQFGNQNTEDFGAAQVAFDTATERLLAAQAKMISQATARIEEIENWLDREGWK